MVGIGSNLKPKMASLYDYLARRLQISQAPKLILTHDAVNAKQPFGKTGYYDHADKSIRIYITNRHPTDILRSFAHEVIHHWQNQHGKLGSQTDPHYAQNDQGLRKCEMEAYLLGNIIFRDWQDEQRYGAPDKLPFLVSLNENIAVSNPTKLRDIVKQMIRNLIANHIIVSYNRNLSSGQMNVNDWVEDLTNKVSSELGRQINTINDKSDFESQSAMVK